MADHGHHDPGGHELEAINTKLLFRLLISLSLVTLLAAAAVVQWFNSQRRELEHRYAAEGSFQLADYKTKMSADLEGIDRVVGDMVANQALLQAPPAPSGWIHPDDLVGGGTPAATAPAEPADKPAEPTEGDVAEGDVAEGDPAAGEGAEGAAEGEGDEPVEVNADTDKPVEVKADKPEGDADKADEADKPKSNNGKGDENKADKADKPKSNNGKGDENKADKADDNG